MAHEHEGHRARLIAKLDKNVLEEHEILEVLLFNAVPRRNTNDLAHRLLARFGTIKDIFDATVFELKQVDGVGENVASYLYCIGVFYKKYYAPAEKLFPEKYVADEFLHFVKQDYPALRHEVMDFYLLDGNANIIKRKRYSNADKHRVVLNPTDFTKVLIKEKAEGLVVVHNHPTGALSPSKNDDSATMKMQVLCSIHNILFCDHIIFAQGGVYSYYQSGRMKQFSNDYSIANIMKKEKGGK